MNKHRCAWSGTDPLYNLYHDTEWGVPVHNDRKLFEMLTLEGAQAGLSWITVLRKRENYKEAFENFDPKNIVKYNSKKILSLMKNEGIVRNRLKIHSVVSNAKAFLEIQKEFGSFDRYIWQFVGGKQIVNKRKSIRDIPPKTIEAEAMSKDLKKRRFRFVGPTICYAFMQACGLVNDHEVQCFRYKQVS
jgi:DNA-3-methyladenine glycosylase I